MFHIWRRVSEGVTRRAFTVYGSAEPGEVARDLARALGGRVEQIPALDLPTDSCGLYGRRYGRTARTPARVDPPSVSALADWINAGLADSDSHCLVSFAVEACWSWEMQELNAWHGHRSGWMDHTEGIGEGSPVRCRAVAYGPATESILKGFPAELYRYVFSGRVFEVTSRRTAIALAAAAGVAAAAQLFAPVATALANGVTPSHAAGPDLVALATLAALAVVAGACGLYVAAAGLIVRHPKLRWLDREQTHLAEDLRWGLVQIERVWRVSPWRWTKYLLAPVFIKETIDRDSEAPRGRAVTRAFPYRDATLALNPGHVAQLFALPSVLDTSTDSAHTTLLVPASAAARNAVGNRVGYDCEGFAMRIPDRDRYAGICATGDPGTGKTLFLYGAFFGDLIARKWGTTPGAGPQRGGQMSLIWLENKGEQVPHLTELFRRAGYRPGRDAITIDVAAAHGPRLELCDRANPVGSAARLVSAMTYAFETGSIGPRAAEALRVVFQLALSVTDDIASGMGWTTAPNVMRLANLIMGGAPNPDVKKVLLDALAVAAERDLAQRQRHSNGDAAAVEEMHTAFDKAFEAAGDRGTILANVNMSSGSPLWDAFTAWTYYERMQPRLYAELIESPRNKISSLSFAEELWTPQPDRPAVTLRQLLEHNAACVINFGSIAQRVADRTAAGGDERLDETLITRLSAMTLYLLWATIKGHCHGWQAAGRSIGIYCDETATISGTGSGEDVIREMFDRGRDLGVQLALATQRFDQLPDRTQRAMRSFGTRAYLATENLDNATAAAVDLTGGAEGSFGARDIRQLPVLQALIRMRVNGTGQPPCNLYIPTFDELDLTTWPSPQRAVHHAAAGDPVA